MDCEEKTQVPEETQDVVSEETQEAEETQETVCEETQETESEVSQKESEEASITIEEN